jgi:hypothetical protein
MLKAGGGINKTVFISPFKGECSLSFVFVLVCFSLSVLYINSILRICGWRKGGNGVGFNVVWDELMFRILGMVRSSSANQRASLRELMFVLSGELGKMGWNMDILNVQSRYPEHVVNASRLQALIRCKHLRRHPKKW